jgi:hypothetical protein
MTIFKQQLSFWYYKNSPRSHGGFHMTGESLACQWLSDTFAKSTFIAVDLELMRVSKSMLRVPNCLNGAAKAVDFLYAKIAFDRIQTQPIALTGNHPTLKIVFNEAGRHSLIKGIDDIREGRGDYCIGEDGNELSFWWLPSER